MSRSVHSESPRINFDNFLRSIIAVFSIMTNEIWNEIMYDYMRTVGSLAVPYFIMLVIVGNYILFKLFLAILINNFSTTVKKQEEKDKLKKPHRIELIMNEFYHICFSIFLDTSKGEKWFSKLKRLCRYFKEKFHSKITVIIIKQTD